MHIKCWGSRGSIPVSGKNYLKYGGETTCIEVRSSKGDTIIIDAGSGIRALGLKLIKEKLSGVHILFTHTHLDHILGFPFFLPLFDSSFIINVYGYSHDSYSIKNILNGIMRSPYFPIDLETIQQAIKFINISDKPFRIGSIEIQPIFLNHPGGGLGYRFEENGSVFIFLTDNELLDEMTGKILFHDYVEFCKNADLLIHDAEFNNDEYQKFKFWGHSSYTEAIRLGIKANAKRIGLFHLNSSRTDDQVDFMVNSSKNIVSELDSSLEVFAVNCGFKTVV
ncbi:MAG TPA: MBL fold metallo-hydrolase [Mariniphaga sp.]|nr:MBL fold metallo-hydrolase [Mariniphaga sp.]